MTADHGSDPGRQRTVAELLEQYGAEGRSGGGRRRRRSAEPEPADPGSPAPVADADLDEPARPDSSDDRTWDSYEPPRRSSLDEPNGTGSFGPGTFGGPGTFSSSAGPADGGSALDGLDSADWARPSYGGGLPLSAPDPLTGSGSHTGGFPEQPYRASIYQGDSFAPGQQAGETTEQLPRYRDGADRGDRTQLTGPITSPIDDAPAGAFPPAARRGPGGTGVAGTGVAGTGALGAVGNGLGRRPADEVDGDDGDDGGPSTEISSRAALFDDDIDNEDRDLDDEPAERDGEPDTERDELSDTDAGTKKAGRKARRAAAKEAREAREARDTPAGLDDGDEIDEEPSALRAWAVLIGLGVLGAVGGGALWIGFRYLWLQFPVVALAAAVVATAGLVLVVRTIRGSEDLRTTMMAVLVGLIVTISPAVLLLTSVR